MASLIEIDGGVIATRDDHRVFRYRVRRRDTKIRGIVYEEGDVVLLSGIAAWNEVLPRGDIELMSPDPVAQTDDPETWEAEYASKLVVHLNDSTVMSCDSARIRAEYGGNRGTARVEISFDCGPWFANGFLTLIDAIRVRAELDLAIGEMKRCLANGEDLRIHQAGGSF